MKVPATALVALIALYGMPTARALTAKTIEKNCKELTVCYKGANKAVSCTIATTDCPPCVTFIDGGCYEKQSDGTCLFGSLCSTYWEDDSSTATGSGSAGTSAAAASAKSSSGTAGVATAGKNSTSTTNATASSHASAAGAGTAGSSTSDSKGSDMSVVFAIIGAAMGVIAVAVIFLTLVRRSRAAHEDDDDVATPPAAMNKEPVTSTAAVTYASYDRNRGMSGGAPLAVASEPSVASYYSQQPKDLPIASPRVAGRAVPAVAVATTSSVASYYAQQPQNLPATSPRVGRAIPASAPRPAPAPAPAARAMPMFANNAPLSNPHQQQYQQQQQEVVYHQAPPAVQVQEAPRRVSSPRNRRESFEF